MEIREMISFELGKEIEKDVLFVLSRAWDKGKKIPSPHVESNLKPSDSALRCSTTELWDSTVSKVHYEVHMTRVLHTAMLLITTSFSSGVSYRSAGFTFRFVSARDRWYQIRWDAMLNIPNCVSHELISWVMDSIIWIYEYRIFEQRTNK